MERLDVDGVGLEVRRVGPRPGRAPTLVLLHEGLGCAALWRDFPERLAEATGWGVLAYSRAGYGASDPVELPRPLSYMHDEGREVLPALLEAAGVEDGVLVGHSDGASIAVVYLGTRPDPPVRGAVLLAPHVFVEDRTVASIEAARVAWEEGDLRARLARWHGANVDAAFRGWNGAWLDPGFRSWNLEAFLPAIACPLLALQGEDDAYGTPAQLDAIRRGAGGPVEARLLERCGHSPHLDRPEATVAAVAEFVAGH